MIRFLQASKSYQTDQPVLHPFDLLIRRGEYVFLSGRSGAGKSTLLKMMYAAELPTSGEVTIGGQDISLLSPLQLPYIRRKIGIVFQDFKLLPRRTVFENVAFTLEVIGCPRSQIERRVLKILREVGLEACASKLPAFLSGGEKQRVAIARALVHEPWLLLADEPTGNLDNDMAHEIIALFEAANQRGTTLVIATHDRHLIERSPIRLRRLLHLDQGHVLENSNPSSIPDLSDV